MKYIIDIDDEPVEGLYKAKGFNSLVFDKNGLDRLTPYKNVVSSPTLKKIKDLKPGTSFSICGYKMELLSRSYRTALPDSYLHQWVNGCFCIFKEAIAHGPYSHNYDNSWESSSVREYLHEYLNYIENVKLKRLLLPVSCIRGIHYISLISKYDFDLYNEYISKRENPFWTCTKFSKYPFGVYAVKNNNCHVLDVDQIADIVPVVILDGNITVNTKI